MLSKQLRKRKKRHLTYVPATNLGILNILISLTVQKSCETNFIFTLRQRDHSFMDIKLSRNIFRSSCSQGSHFGLPSALAPMFFDKSTAFYMAATEHNSVLTLNTYFGQQFILNKKVSRFFDYINFHFSRIQRVL